MRVEDSASQAISSSAVGEQSRRTVICPADDAAGSDTAAGTETTTGLSWVTANARVTEPVFIGDYRLIASLGRGGMAEVFLAVRSGMAGFHKLFVIKRLRRDLFQLPHRNKYRTLLLDEARLAARLSHPNIVQTYEVGEVNGMPFLAMEYLEGQPLSRVLARLWQTEQRLEIDLAVQVVIDVLSGLSYAHGLTDYDGEPLRIIHRDISHDNLFWTYDGAVKLLDFGVAKFALNTLETDTGVVKGKFPYMAPEQARGRSIDHRADLFSMGIVMWELIAGRHLIHAATTAVSVERLLYGELPSLAEVVPDIDPELARICCRALERDLRVRYRTAGEMRFDLERVQASRSGGRADLAGFLQKLFHDERASVGLHIRQALTSLAEPIVQAVPDPASRTASVTTADSEEARVVSAPIGGAAQAEPAGVRWRSTRGARAVLALGAVTALVAAVIGWRGCVDRASDEPAPASDAHAPADAAHSVVPGARVSDALTLRLCGSNTIGADLAPALVDSFLRRKGAEAIARESGPGHARLTGRLSGASITVEIHAAGSATAFTGLQERTCDIGMASRAPTGPERAALRTAGLGELTSAATEHVIGLDGIAVIVHPGNPLSAIDRGTLRDIFTGKVTDWSQLGGAAGPITLAVRDDNSGTLETFRSVVLGDEPLRGGAHRSADSRALSDEVAGDVSAIGVVGLAYVRSAKVLAIGDPGAPAKLPTSLTVTTESYLLSRRLYLYTPLQPRTPLATELSAFALSPQGQAVVRDTGFVDLDVALRDIGQCDGQCPPSYAALAAHARRLSLDFRFHTGSDEIDTRAARDLDRVVRFLRGYPDAKVVLLGFSDGAGSADANLKLSRQRAATIAHELELRGIHAASSDGMGAAMPVASNATEADRQRNRRVEVWVDGVQ